MHGTWATAEGWAKITGMAEEQASFIVDTIHTSPQAFGKIMSQAEPRLAVAHHYWNHRDLEFDIYAGIRETYDGPLALAADLTVINVTPGPHRGSPSVPRSDRLAPARQRGVQRRPA